MTRLKNKDIRDISARLDRYNQDLLTRTGRSLLGIACHACGADESRAREDAKGFCIHVVPVTAGLGIISDFSQTVCAILRFIGFNARVSLYSDTSGIARAYEQRADAIMMADDSRFVGINLVNRRVVDNSEMTGRVFAAALDLMADGIRDQEVLVMGCGPVGESAARTLLAFDAHLWLMDQNQEAARALKNKISKQKARGSESAERIRILPLGKMPPPTCQYILEATPSINTLPDSHLSDRLFVAAPGVPLGVSEKGCQILENRLVHDKLELGVAAMAVGLLNTSPGKGGYGE